MSQIRVNDIRDSGGGNSSTPAQIASGRAKAWVNFNGQGTVAIRADYNVNTISDLGTGSYQVNFSSAISSNYSAVLSNSFQSNSATSAVINTDSYATTNFRMFTFIATVGDRDCAILTAAVFR